MKRHWERLALDLNLKPKILLQDLSAFCQSIEAAISSTLQCLAPQGLDAAFCLGAPGISDRETYR
jgi:hypothetical protein